VFFIGISTAKSQLFPSKVNETGAEKSTFSVWIGGMWLVAKDSIR
jgi:hypothetical protein